MELTLAEELFLIALDDKKGRPAGSAAETIRFGLAGSLLAELAILNKLSLDPKKRLVVVDRLLPENPLLSYVFTQIVQNPRNRVRLLPGSKTWGTNGPFGWLLRRLWRKISCARKKNDFSG